MFSLADICLITVVHFLFLFRILSIHSRVTCLISVLQTFTHAFNKPQDVLSISSRMSETQAPCQGDDIHLIQWSQQREEELGVRRNCPSEESPLPESDQTQNIHESDGLNVIISRDLWNYCSWRVHV